MTPDFNFSLVLVQLISLSFASGQKTYSLSDQSKSMGQRRVPVHSYLNPQSSFLFWFNNRFRVWPMGTIQSRTVLLRLWVSSPLAPDTPIWSCGLISKWLLYTKINLPVQPYTKLVLCQCSRSILWCQDVGLWPLHTCLLTMLGHMCHTCASDSSYLWTTTFS